MNDDTSWEANHRYIRWFASKALQRALAAGIRGVQLEDLIQEASIAWMTARDRYDPSRGVPFIPFLRRGVQFHLNRWLKYEIEECKQSNLSLDYEYEAGSGEPASFVEFIPDRTFAPADEVVISNQIHDHILNRLSPLARRYVELLESPPPEVYAELKAVMAKAELGRAMGLNRFAPVRVSSDLIFRLMGLNAYERAKIMREVEAQIEKVAR